MQYEAKELAGSVKEFIQIMKDSGLSYMHIKNDKFELKLGEIAPQPMPMPPMPVPQMMPAMPVQGAAPAEAAAAPAPAVSGKSIKSPIVGTFYSAPAPGKPPFVKVGDKVNSGDVVCIVESMKVMNEIEADISGTVAQIAVKDGEAVEYGQALIIIE